MMAFSVTWRIPSILYLPFGCSLGFRKQSKHVLALSEVASEIGPTWEESNLFITVTEFALKSLGPMFLVFMSLQICSARALVVTEIAAEHFPLEMDI